MMLPGLVYLIANNYLPMFGILIAFKKVNFSVGLLKSDWVGLSNFEYLFKTKDAFVMIRCTGTAPCTVLYGKCRRCAVSLCHGDNVCTAVLGGSGSLNYGLDANAV